MKKLICMLLSLCLFCAPALAIKGEVVDPNELPYIPSEGGPSNWAVSEIESAMQAGLVPVLTGSPKYQEAITREQFAELIVQSVEVMLDQDLEAAPANTFIDSSNPAVLKASQASIVNGVGENKFAPDVTTNREEIATMIARAVKYIEQNNGTDLAPKAASIAGFADQAQVSKWAVEGVGLLAANGIMNGTSATTLSPKESCTVEQSILLCYRLYVKFLAA
ncbi:S-layer homology domain-containing protein [Agathobaculum sp. LCP25S3_E8]|uniref:S-layer homology domain-containing protein n=1 Tax=Agathobaculum sp. LCP25S3_E8 TaxID=3438735 RepID=UPI003F9063A6